MGPSLNDMKSLSWFRCLKGQSKDTNARMRNFASVERVFSKFAFWLRVDKAQKRVSCFWAFTLGMDLILFSACLNSVIFHYYVFVLGGRGISLFVAKFREFW